MQSTNKDILPVDAFRHLKEQNLPLIVSFPLEEEKGYMVTGKGICFVEEIYGTSRVKFGRFSPNRAIYAIKNAVSFYATFDVGDSTFGCIIENITADRSFLVSDIPRIISPFYRKFLRIEPSRKAPVLLYISTEEHGTISHPIRDISERGIGFVIDRIPVIANKLTCGLYVPLDGGIFILASAVIVYNKQVQTGMVLNTRLGAGQGISCGLQLFPHNEDEKKIRLYVMQRELEIRRKIQDML